MNLLAGASAALAWGDGQQTAPLGYAMLWNHDPPRTSQRSPLQIKGMDAILACGGNGSGKPELGGQVAAAVALGREDPAVQAWLSTNQLEPSIIPPYPGIVIASSLNSALSINVQRPAVERYLGPGVEWRNRYGPGFSEAKAPHGGKVRFLTNDAGARALQG